MEGLLVLLGLALLAVPILLVVALVSIAGLKRRVGDLESQVYRLQVAPVAAPTTASARTPEPAPDTPQVADAPPRANVPTGYVPNAEVEMPREPTLAELIAKVVPASIARNSGVGTSAARLGPCASNCA